MGHNNEWSGLALAKPGGGWPAGQLDRLVSCPLTRNFPNDDQKGTCWYEVRVDCFPTTGSKDMEWGRDVYISAHKDIL